MKRQTLLTLLLAISALTSTPTVQANIRIEVPSAEWPGIPFYARISTTEIYHTEEWAAIVFYRDPTCVPVAFNLLDFFDIPGAFGCPATVAGFEVWKDGLPPEDFTPVELKTRGLGAVPVWFVAWPELEAAIADGILTVPELASMASLQIGSAGFYQEVLHPVDGVDPTTGGARVGHITLNAMGKLDDGTQFRFHASGGGELFPGPLVVHEVDIRFR